MSALALALTALAQNGYQVKGVVIDALGPVVGATVMEQGTTVGTSTGLDGDYILTVSSADATVEISCIGYASQTYKASELPATVTLSEDAVFLDDVVVIGYGSQKKKEVTGAVSSIKSEDFNAGVKTNPMGLLQGKVAGLNIIKTTSDPTSTGYNIQIRGFSTLDKGAAMFAKVAEQLKLHGQSQISGKTAFKLYDTFGYPLEMTLELAKEQGLEVDVAGFEEANKKHQELSRTTSAGSFKAGLQDNSAVVTRMHTATHLLHAALHKVLGPTANQKGSNITAERLRFDFTWPEKMTDEQIKQVEDLVNQWIQQGIAVSKKVTTVEEAKNEGAMALFGSKYGDQVTLYTIGDVSKEICCGPHVENTSELGSFKITKEQSSSAGVRRIKAVIGNLSA